MNKKAEYFTGAYFSDVTKLIWEHIGVWRTSVALSATENKLA